MWVHAGPQERAAQSSFCSRTIAHTYVGRYGLPPRSLALSLRKASRILRRARLRAHRLRRARYSRSSCVSLTHLCTGRAPRARDCALIVVRRALHVPLTHLCTGPVRATARSLSTKAPRVPRRSPRGYVGSRATARTRRVGFILLKHDHCSHVCMYVCPRRHVDQRAGVLRRRRSVSGCAHLTLSLHLRRSCISAQATHPPCDCALIDPPLHRPCTLCAGLPSHCYAPYTLSLYRLRLARYSRSSLRSHCPRGYVGSRATARTRRAVFLLLKHDHCLHVCRPACTITLRLPVTSNQKSCVEER